jgi:hypothetical protein
MNKKKKKQKLSGAEKKAETIRKRQEPLKRKLIEMLEEVPNLGAALSRIGINRSTFCRWREDDPNFSIEVRHATERAVEHTADLVEISLLNSAREGKVPAQKYFLRNNHPRYMPPAKWEEQRANPLTEERKKQIVRAMKAWSEVDPNEDERDEDYDGSEDDFYGPSDPYDEDGNLIKK